MAFQQVFNVDSDEELPLLNELHGVIVISFYEKQCDVVGGDMSENYQGTN